MVLWEFEKVYVRIVERDIVELECLFIQETSSSLLVFNIGEFFWVNRGETFNHEGFREFDMPSVLDREQPIILKGLYYFMGNSYMDLDGSIIKIYNQFSTQYGTSESMLEVVTPALDNAKYNLWKEEIRLASMREIIDFRYIAKTR
ncbi:hypothetical protein [Chitinophaga varians]|uniref:hypothetical protein n=1 Tax=Chitinophaga varians TaxID=2202339 RepID=UPI00165EF2EB|nr:hypothetical protein [Chitinophaga varians]MBC9913359.1 hypothetical protein [Chitinophaga varians]